MSVAGYSIAPPTVSPTTHAAAAADLVRRYRAVPPGTPVRLGKPSSNLFRFGGAAAQRLDASALTGVIGVDPVARSAEVQGMTTYEHLVDA
ncbi:MAG TPA: FAD-binding protein, partial [Pseudonocardia sp.]|nr:FAD-binding protein [Pseudonocardia sp.]